ncbi:hypothetical protein E2C01_072706 [Portunus trituberculatus]|uniref:Uncharacterized protein n=1 Tax=Portunus trituberculatus TaxID=210409 RepID=A0A5B7I7E0_PORTR|nr:hypothetical protein [Portunus trituberculatus]
MCDTCSRLEEAVAEGTGYRIQPSHLSEMEHGETCHVPITTYNRFFILCEQVDELEETRVVTDLCEASYLVSGDTATLEPHCITSLLLFEDMKMTPKITHFMSSTQVLYKRCPAYPFRRTDGKIQGYDEEV